MKRSPNNLIRTLEKGRKNKGRLPERLQASRRGGFSED